MDEKNTAGAHRPGAQTTAATGGGRNGGAGGGNPNPNPNANTIAAIAAAVNNMEESFVVLPSSVSRTPRDVAGVGLDARFAALARIFDMASDETGVDHPMCLECAAQLREELDARVKETQAECETYRECLRDLGEELSDEDEDEEEDEEEEAGAGDAEDAGSSPGRGKGKGGRRKRAGGGKGKGRGGGGGGGGSGSRTATSTTRTRTKKEEEEEEEEAALAADLARCEAEEAAELARAATLEAELDKLRAERRRLEDRGRELDAREDGYWNDFNDFKLSLRSHVEERDRLVVNIEQTSRQLERLRRTNVFNDAFHIWFDGPFGTVNGFRLGRLPSVAVEWDEINAAWGMACLLLSTMAQSVKLRFRAYTLQPLGSFSKVVDARGNSYELYGPVNILSSHKYDRAMAGFLACLQEFAQFAAERDKQNGVEPAFELPYQIDGDKIDGRKIAFPFNRYERWTAALKIMLTDLKTCLAWLSNNQQ